MALLDYIANVRTTIRDNNTNSLIFTDDEIQSFIQAGTMFYSRFKPRMRPYTLELKSEVKQYTLPSDWIKADQVTFDEATRRKPVDLTQFASFVLPTLNASPSFDELEFVFYDSDQLLMVNPAPGQDADIDFIYYGLHTIDTVPAIDSHAVTLASASQALNTLAVDRGLKMQKYRVGLHLQIDDSEIAKRMQEQAQKFYDEFERLVRFRPFGVMG